MRKIRNIHATLRLKRAKRTGTKLKGKKVTLMKKSQIAGFVIVVILYLTLTADSTVASTIIKRSFDQVAQGAELIIEARVLSKESRLSPANNMPYTYFTFEIIDIIKGACQDLTIEIGFLGGQWGDFTLTVSDMRMPEINEKGIYFVETLHEQQIHPLFGWQQGHYLIISDSQSGQDVVVPVRDITKTSKSHSLMIQQGIPLENFKQNIRHAIGGAQ